MAEVHSYVRFYPGTNVDYIKVVASTTDTMEEAMEERTVMKTDTVLLTKFNEEQVDASYFSMLADNSTSIFTIYKKTPDQNYYQYVCTIDTKNYKFTDYNIVSNQFYHYLASAELANMTEDGNIGYIIYENLTDDNEVNYLHPIFDSWSICDVIPSTSEENLYIKSGTMWNLGLNLSGEELTLNTNVASWDTLGRFPKFSIGARKYHSMSFTGLLGEMQEYKEYIFGDEGNANTATTKKTYAYTEKAETYNTKASDDSTTKKDERWGVWNPYATENDKLLAWNEFITDGELKLLRDRKGNAWIMQVVDSTNSSINIVATGQPTTITFSWKEAINIADSSIVIFGDNTED